MVFSLWHQNVSKFLYLWENTSMPLNFTAWTCVRKTFVPQSNNCITHFETCSWTKAEWSVTVWATSGQRRAHWFPKDLICPLSRPFPLHFLEKQSQSHICFQLTLLSWFSLAEVEKLASSGGKTRKQWWSIFSFTLAISMVPVRHYNCSWHFFFLLFPQNQTRNSGSSTIPQVPASLCNGPWSIYNSGCLFSVASGVHFVVAVGLQRAHCWR